LVSSPYHNPFSSLLRRICGRFSPRLIQS
jgi:hypothetical protein